MHCKFATVALNLFRPFDYLEADSVLSTGLLKQAIVSACGFKFQWKANVGIINPAWLGYNKFLCVNAINLMSTWWICLTKWCEFSVAKYHISTVTTVYLYTLTLSVTWCHCAIHWIPEHYSVSSKRVATIWASIILYVNTPPFQRLMFLHLSFELGKTSWRWVFQSLWWLLQEIMNMTLCLPFVFELLTACRLFEMPWKPGTKYRL